MLGQSHRSLIRLPLRAFSSKPDAGKGGEAAHDDHGAHASHNWGSDSSKVPGREYLRETGERANQGMIYVLCIVIVV